MREIVIEGLQELLSEIEALPVPPRIGSPEYRADVEGYRAQVQKLDEIRDRTTGTVVLALPQEVKSLYDQIQRAYRNRMFPRDEVRELLG